MTSIWWIRRDLRLHDNLALTAASARSGSEVVPLYIFDPNIAGASAHRDANHRRDFLFDGLEHLDRDLHGRGSGLVFRTGPAADVLAAVAAEVNASTILAERDHTPSARARDAAIAKILPLELLGSPAARAPGDVLKPDGEPYRMFAPYRRAWRALPPLRSSELLSVPQFLPTRARIGSEQIPPHAPSPLQAGVVEARARLDGFTRGAQPAVLGYGEGRDRLDHPCILRIHMPCAAQERLG